MVNMRILLKKMFLIAVCVYCQLAASLAYADGTKATSGYRDYVDAYFTSIAAASCLGSYLEDRSAEFSYLRSMGWSVESHIDRLGNVETHYSVAKRYFYDVKKEIFLITFRGSASKDDWKINLKTKKVNYGGNTLQEMEELAEAPAAAKAPAVHGGFNTYAHNILKNSVVASDGSLMGVFNYARNKDNTRLLLVGHSMGGAVATLVAARLADLGFPRERLYVINFGAPAIGNDEFNKTYADKLNILRITNTNDPIPGSLQTFFSGYKQCGRNEKYHLSMQIGNIQHNMGMYFDHSIINLHKIKDREIASGLIKRTPRSRIIEGKPKVALWIRNSPGLAKMSLMPDLRRLLIDQYALILPSYMILNDKLDENKEYLVQDIVDKSVKFGADYVLVCGIDGKQVKESDKYWYLTYEQWLFDKKGNMLTMVNFSKKTVPAVGNVQVAGECYMNALKELNKHLTFIGPKKKLTVRQV